MIELTISRDTIDGKELTTYTLEGDTYAKKDAIKKLGFYWKIPVDIAAAIGPENADDPMFKSDKRWTVTKSTSGDSSQERIDWIDEVKKTLEIE